ncbi:MAG: IS66 family insertion sequence element accessory protein TnpB [Clostridiales bacterium]|nr:IS66 family insertion sequence element accessory protein TnpB [Clostridiales bacterium]
MDHLTVATDSQKLSLWIERIGECRASNQKVFVWCTAHDVNINSYYYWLRKIKREAFDAIPAERKPKVPTVSSQPSKFAEVPHANANFCSSTAVIIRLGNTTLEIQNGADQETIENTLRTIRHLC